MWIYETQTKTNKHALGRSLKRLGNDEFICGYAESVAPVTYEGECTVLNTGVLLIGLTQSSWYTAGLVFEMIEKEYRVEGLSTRKPTFQARGERKCEIGLA